MAKIPYIDYNNLEPYYTINEACKLLKLSTRELSIATYNYGIGTTLNKFGEPVFSRHAIRTLHNSLYYESRRKRPR